MPVVLSKVFEKCVHTGPCTNNALYQCYRFYLSNARYYAPFLAIQLLPKLKKLSPQVFKDALSYYIQCTTVGFAMGWTIHNFMCIFRNLLGEYKENTLVYIPSLIGALHIFWCSPRVRRLFVVTITQCTLETILLRRRNFLTKTLSNSLILQTFVFMSCSALILYAKQTGDFKGFWLLTPTKKEQNIENTENTEVVDTKLKLCMHENKTCNQYLVEGVRKYLIFGLMLDTVKTLLSRPTVKGQKGILLKLVGNLRNFKIQSTALLASYIGIYRFTNCYFNRKDNTDADSNQHKASFLSGICYLFQPNITLLSYAVISSVQILYQIFKRKEIVFKKEDVIWKYLNQMPKIFFVFGLAHLIHNYTIYADVSNLAASVINNTTDNYAAMILGKIQKYRQQQSIAI